MKFNTNFCLRKKIKLRDVVPGSWDKIASCRIGNVHIALVFTTVELTTIEAAKTLSEKMA
uniref:Uncharacterized protein n=1 Tax=Rhizophora mucronata TaxID=61149 RepID=A0A2P2PB03_RHIMU